MSNKKPDTQEEAAIVASEPNPVSAEHVPNPWEKVDLYVEPSFDINSEAYELVGVNGRLYQIPKGKHSMVPLCVAEEYRRSRRAIRHQAATIRNEIVQSS